MVAVPASAGALVDAGAAMPTAAGTPPNTAPAAGAAADAGSHDAAAAVGIADDKGSAEPAESDDAGKKKHRKRRKKSADETTEEPATPVPPTAPRLKPTPAAPVEPPSAKPAPCRVAAAPVEKPTPAAEKPTPAAESRPPSRSPRRLKPAPRREALPRRLRKPAAPAENRQPPRPCRQLKSSLPPGPLHRATDHRLPVVQPRASGHGPARAETAQPNRWARAVVVVGAASGEFAVAAVRAEVAGEAAAGVLPVPEPGRAASRAQRTAAASACWADDWTAALSRARHREQRHAPVRLRRWRRPQASGTGARIRHRDADEQRAGLPRQIKQRLKQPRCRLDRLRSARGCRCDPALGSRPTDRRCRRHRGQAQCPGLSDEQAQAMRLIGRQVGLKLDQPLEARRAAEAALAGGTLS